MFSKHMDVMEGFLYTLDCIVYIDLSDNPNMFYIMINWLLFTALVNINKLYIVLQLHQPMSLFQC